MKYCQGRGRDSDGARSRKAHDSGIPCWLAADLATGMHKAVLGSFRDTCALHNDGGKGSAVEGGSSVSTGAL